MKNKKKIQKKLTPLTTLAILSAMSTPSFAEDVPFTLVTNWYAQAEHGGFYQAIANDLYKKEGLNVTIRMGGPQVNTIQLLAAKKAQCALVDEMGAMAAQNKGIPIKIVATSFQFDPTVIITHSDINSLPDLKGKTVLISGGAHSSWWPWAKNEYGFTDSMTRPYTFNIQPFVLDKNISQQGFLTSEPFAMKQANADYKVFMIGKDGYPPYGNSIACRTDIIESKPALVSGFVKATMEGWKEYLTNPSKGNVLIVKDNPNMTQAQLNYSVAELKSTGIIAGGDAAEKGIGIITDERMKKTWKMAVDFGLFKSSDVDINEVYTTEFIDNVKVKL